MLELASRERFRPASDDVAEEAVESSGILLELLSIAKSTRAYYGLRLAALGFHNGQDEFLLALGDETISVTALSEQLSVRPSTTSKMLDRLVAKDLCERTVDRRDARRTLVKITAAGIGIRREILQLRQDVEAELRKNMDANAYSAMKQSLNQCSSRLSTQLRRIR